MRTLRFTLLLLACAFATGAAAQYPDKPIRLIVPQAAGSATDTVARILGAELAKEIGQQIVVDNRPGGALTIGLDLDRQGRARRLHALHGADRRAGDHPPHGDEAAVRHRARLPADRARNARAPAARGLAGGCRSSRCRRSSNTPRRIQASCSNASSSNGSPGHVGGELFKFMTDTDIGHVPYRGGAPAINDLIAGRVHLMFESLNSIAPHARSGTVRALAVSGARRSPGFPDLPTVAEAGVPGYEAPTWNGVIAPAGVPRPIVDKLNAAINRAIASQTFQDRFAMIGDEPAGGTPEEFAETIRKDSAKWRDVISRSGARLD